MTLGVNVFSLKLSMDLYVFNIYGLCHDRATFRKNCWYKSFLKEENVIIEGDLNFLLGASEVWGSEALLDPMEFFLLGN